MKVLIYYDVNQLKPTGGPSGYLFNLSKGLEANSNIFFLRGHQKTKPAFKKPKLPHFLIRYLKDLIWRKRAKKIFDFPRQTSDIVFDNYDIVHFHTTGDLFNCRQLLKDYHGKVLLTSHCPKAPYLEIMEDMISKRELAKHKKIYERLEEVDRYAFERADYLVFPCQDAEEPYLNTWGFYRQKSDEYDFKKKYIPTGIVGCSLSKSRQDIRESYGIPKDAFVISYVGRHSEVKGYDTLIKMWSVYQDNPNVYFLICGKTGDIAYPNDKRWIEVGWTDSPMDYVAASDLYILPNKETYFDLVLLEVLSIGQLILCSRTGGNKYFEQFKKSGIYFYDDFSSLTNTIKKIMSMPSEERAERQAENKKLFDNNFTVKEFAKNYQQLYESIFKQN